MLHRTLLTIAAGACLYAADMTGHYTLQGVREVGSELQLKKDGTFEYMLAYGAADYWAKGTWRAEEGAVILNSAPGKQAEAFRLTTSSVAHSAAVRIRLTGANGRAVPNIDVKLITADGPRQARTDSAGIALFEESDHIKAAQFEVRVYSFQSDPIPLNPAHNDFSFEINGDAITQVRFKNERLAIDKGALLLKYWGGDREMRYTKSNVAPDERR